ncbi:protoporphyrinogen oxidase HemJ [Roseomonas sp. NAR14]|uniref:Protoporphyrinogen IX oxidase n=1 Tax=Roseomonas acroporae TaxID=2937791 RepID=A0A9X1YB37_9PROT|nr:protoporphyrinogen oxidase HemJ [Roseomonas acroporae]MCK8785675.1 protoporphyrinogen oxidase HemJ [Roseomonas acroporae]
MIEALVPWYLWLKAFHLIAVFAWMAGLFYLPRLFVYHAQVAPGGAESERFKLMERRLLRGIMGPAMHAAVTFGLLLVLTPGVVDWRAGWWHGKLLGIVGMLAVHIYLARAQRRYARDERPGSERHWRIVNEVPTVLLVLIVIMVIVKPF